MDARVEKYREALRDLCIAHAKYRTSRPQESTRRYAAAEAAIVAVSRDITSAEKESAHAVMRAEFGENYLPMVSGPGGLEIA